MSGHHRALLADLGKGVVTTVSEAVDKQTDELQDKEEDAPKKD